MPAEKCQEVAKKLKITIGQAIISVIIGVAMGIIIALLTGVGDNTSEIIYGNSLKETRFWVWFICFGACIATETVAGKSARAVAIDAVISFLITLFFVANENFFDATDTGQSLSNVFGAIVVSVFLAAFCSDIFVYWTKKALDAKPFQRND